MKKMRCTYIFLLTFLVMMGACQKQDTALCELDYLIEGRYAIHAHHQNDLDSLCRMPMEQLNDRDRFERYGQIFDRYRAFNIDSQLVYADKRLALSRSIDDAFYREAAQMNMSEVMMRLGMYHDAIQYLDSSSAKGVIDVLYPYYYNLRRTLYGLMADFAISEAQQTSYLSLKRLYTDSLMQVQEPGSFYQEVVHADGLCAEGQYTEALELLSRYESQHSISADQQAISAITKAQIYHKLGMTDQEKEQLIISACSDMQAAIREYISLRELALLLYHSGDIDNAYRYMRCAIEDAKAGCARGRTIELGMLYPIIESAYQRHEQVHHRLLIGFMSSIVLVAALLAVFLLYNARQRRRLASLNKQLQVTYSELKESDQIKAMYVGRYMEMSSLLIDRFDSWRKALNQQFKNNEIAKVQQELASHHFTQEQLATFYRNFDEAFLNIFPNFINDVKQLLVDGTEFRIKSGEQLNTDLRVLCCIRLGITDSAKIASFLRYSLSTIFNARTRMRNLAKGDRDSFEKKVAML